MNRRPYSQSIRNCAPTYPTNQNVVYDHVTTNSSTSEKISFEGFVYSATSLRDHLS